MATVTVSRRVRHQQGRHVEVVGPQLTKICRSDFFQDFLVVFPEAGRRTYSEQILQDSDSTKSPRRQPGKCEA
jgi:hypothetical protein